jgi:hypothetical protein
VRGVCIRTSGSHLPVNTREDSLRDRPLQVARQSGPSSTTEGAELTAQTFRRESEQLGQHPRAFDIDRAKGLEHHRSKQVRLTLETEVILLVFALLGILFAGLDHSNIRLRQGTGNRHINRQTFAFTPDRNRHIARASARGGAKNTLLLHDRTQQTIRSHSINQISQVVMTNNDVTGLSAANGVVAEHINGLHAHRASGIRVDKRNTESVKDCGAIDAWRQDGVITVFA